MGFDYANPRFLVSVVGCLILLALTACGGDDGAPVFKVGGIPDQNSSRLARRYSSFADYLSEKLDVEVKYIPSVDYAAVVTAFAQGELQLAFFGGLTGVQARQQSAGAQAIVQRIQDAQFHSRFIAGAGLSLESLEDLKDLASKLTFTFGSESSTSGHLMPRYFLTQAGIDPDNDFRQLPNYSGSHDLTWKLVESGTFNVGALSEDVWNRAVVEGDVDLSKVRSFFVTPEYYDYNWTVPGSLDAAYGSGFTEKLRQALLDLNTEEHADILELFSTQGFIISNNGNYEAIEDAARNLGIVQ